MNYFINSYQLDKVYIFFLFSQNLYLSYIIVKFIQEIIHKHFNS